VTEEEPGGRGPERGRSARPIARGTRLVVAVAVVLVVVAGGALVVWRADDRLSVGGAAGPPGQVGVPWERALLSLDGERVAVRFEGAPLGGDQPCGAYYVGLSSALRQALRVTVITLPGPDAPDGGACPADRTTRCVEVRLPYPPDGRPILDTMTGVAPPLEQAPTTLGTAGHAPGAGGGEAPGDLCAQLTGG
jgi:hypothetical protein